jgi:hypothetical protein
LATTGGTGTGLTVDVVAGGGYIDINSITINNPGTGYTVDDVITINNENNFPGTFTISSSSSIGVWTHVAIVNDQGTQTVWYDGVEQTKVSGTFGTANYANGTDSLAIGTLSGGNNYFDGKMAMVRISNTAKYSAAFTPSVTYGVEADTKLFLSSDTPLVDSESHTITNNGVTVSDDFPIGSMTAFVSGWNTVSDWLTPSVAGNPDLTPVVAGWTVTGPLGFTATVIGSPFSNGSNWVISVDASLDGFTGSNSGNYTFTPPA